MPDSPGVAPPGSSSSIALNIFSFSAPLVVLSITPVSPPYTTMATESLSRKLFTKSRKEDFNNGNRLGISIDPDTSIKKTKWLGGNESKSSFAEDRFTKNN
ncbi:MAG: hypothetical protein BWZ05_01719 [Bacteroidetes bacterium ADurb.BinA245]|nr:MAG: hypothetical protein BWZ05_01719 [Bacteroidetes bacterium ADurb.BinA245]